MTVDFPSSYPANTPSASKPADIQTLQETFAALLRSYGTEKGGSQTESILEAIRPNQTDDVGERDRNQQRRENQQYVERNDFTQIDRKSLDKSEIRSGEMNSDYQNRVDKQQTLQENYREKAAHNESQLPVAPSAMPASMPSDAARHHELLPTGNPASPQRNVPEVVVANNATSSTNAAVPHSPASGGQANVVLPMNLNPPAAIPLPVPLSSSSAPPQLFTVFTPLGRFGQSQGRGEKNEDNDNEESGEEKTDEKKQPFAIFETIRVETTRPIQRDHSQQMRESVSQAKQQVAEKQIAEKANRTPREIDPESSRNIKTMDDLLNTPAHNLSIQKKGESNPPNQTQYINRIAAACEAASQYAPIRMKINLDHLGTLALRFFYKADKLTLRFETPSKASAQFLRDQLGELKTLLSERNVKIVDIEILQDF